MSYTRRPSILIAREGYSGLGDTADRAAAASYCGKKFGVTSKDFQPCVDFYVSGSSGDYSPGVPSASGSGGALSKIGSFFAGLTKSAVTGYVQGKSTPASTTVYQQSSTPAWVMPVAIGGIGLVALMMLRRRK